MRAAYSEMMGWFHNGFDGNAYFFLYLICLVYLFVTDKDKRWKFVVPSFLLAIFIINPVCYKYLWAKTIGYSYWRLFWTIPIIPIVALTFTNIVTDVKENKNRYVMILLLAFLCYKSGCYLYKYPDTGFVRANNRYKLPNEAVHVADALVDLDETPKAIVDYNIARYMRQIHPEITQGYGRWGDGAYDTVAGKYIFDKFGYGVINTNPENFKTEDGKVVLEDFFTQAHKYMVEEQFEYFVLPTTEEAEKNHGDSVLLSVGFKYIKTVDGFAIYSVN